MTLWGAGIYIPNAYPWPTAYPYATNANDTVFQLFEDSGMTHIQFWQWNYNDTNERNYSNRRWTAAMWGATIDRMLDFNLTAEMVLCYDVAKATELVQTLGSDCMIYEVCKEPHVSGTGCTITSGNYLTSWNNVVDACRDINATAWYGGPAVGSYTTSPTNSPPYLEAWLTGAHDPDFVSVHNFLGNPTTKSSAITRATTYTAQDVADLNTRLANHGMAGLPIMFTESQYTSAAQSGTNPSTNWSWDPAFCDSWTNAFCAACEAGNVHSNYLWIFIGYDNNFALVRPASQSYFRKPQYYSVQDYIGSSITGNKSFTMDQILQGTGQKTFTMDQILSSQQVKSFTMDQCLITPPEIEVVPKEFTMDTCLQGGGNVEFTMDQVLTQDGVVSFTMDQILEAAATPVPWALLKAFENIPRPGKLIIDCKTATIDGKQHQIDCYHELFRKVLRSLKK